MYNNTLRLGPWGALAVVRGLFNNSSRGNWVPVQGEALSRLGSCTASLLHVSCSNSALCLFLWGTCQGHSTWRQKGEKWSLCCWCCSSGGFLLGQYEVRNDMFVLTNWDPWWLHFRSCISWINQVLVTPLSQHPLMLLIGVQQVHIKLWSLCCSLLHLLCLPSVVPLMTMWEWWQFCSIPDCACVPKPTTTVHPLWSQAAEKWNHWTAIPCGSSSSIFKLCVAYCHVCV